MQAQNTRLNQLVRDSSHARRFSPWYEMRSPKCDRFASPPVSDIRRHRGADTFTGKSSVPNSEWEIMENEIKSARYILQIKNEDELDDFVPYERATFDRAVGFLTRQMIHAHAARVFDMGVPRIDPADKGSIDLYWEKDDRTLLINFPAGTEIANYFGKKPKSEISGRFDPSVARVELISWLADR